jgi:hypothetical protein
MFFPNNIKMLNMSCSINDFAFELMTVTEQAVLPSLLMGMFYEFVGGINMTF